MLTNTALSPVASNAIAIRLFARNLLKHRKTSEAMNCPVSTLATADFNERSPDVHVPVFSGCTAGLPSDLGRRSGRGHARRRRTSAVGLSWCPAVQQPPTSVVRETRTPRSVGAGGG